MCSVNSDNTICSWGRWPLLSESGPRLGQSALMDNDKTQTKQRKSSMSHSDLIFVKCLGNSLYSLSTIDPNMNNTINALSFTGTSPFSENLQNFFLFLQEGLNLGVINCRSCSQQGLYKNVGKNLPVKNLHGLVFCTSLLQHEQLRLLGYLLLNS